MTTAPVSPRSCRGRCANRPPEPSWQRTFAARGIDQDGVQQQDRASQARPAAASACELPPLPGETIDIATPVLLLPRPAPFYLTRLPEPLLPEAVVLSPRDTTGDFDERSEHGMSAPNGDFIRGSK